MGWQRGPPPDNAVAVVADDIVVVVVVLQEPVSEVESASAVVEVEVVSC